MIRLEGGRVEDYGGAAGPARNLNLRLDLDDRIGLLGVNGAGKSTFAKLIAGALHVEHGHMHRDRRLKVGWFHQHQIEALDPLDTPLDIVRRNLPEASDAQRRSRLAQFGLGASKAETTVADLSGGERARLLLNLVAMDAPHLLILDEPTNHLDIDSRRALLDSLNDYEGAVILITHDRSLMELVADRLWLTADGTIKPFDGDMAAYARFVLDRARVAARGPAQTPTVATPKGAPPALGPLKRRLEAAKPKPCWRGKRKRPRPGSTTRSPIQRCLAAIPPTPPNCVAAARGRRRRSIRAEAAWLSAAGGLLETAAAGAEPSRT